MRIPRETLFQIAEYLQGSCKSISEALEAFGLHADEGDVQEQLLEADLEICSHCDWWHEVCELEYDEEQGGSFCAQCREELGIESA